MITPIEFFVHGTPKGQPRPRAFMRGGHAAVYDAGTAEGWKSQVALAAKELRPTTPFSCPLRLSLSFIFPRPKSHFRTGKRSAELRDDAPYFVTGKPDADNLAKAVMDALTQLRMWNDDSQVCILKVSKSYVRVEHPEPGCLVCIAEAVD